MASNSIESTDCTSSLTAADNNNHVSSINLGNTSSIEDFFSNKNIFITGATGFVGQALIEKILRSCPKVSKIYCLIREKKGSPASERLDTTLKNEVYNRVREMQPEFADKVVAIGGDISLPALGISVEDRKLLIDNVNIVVHSAATVRFDERLRKAILMNVCGVNEVIKLCHEIQNLQVLIHISTAYSNAVRSDVQEVFYPSTVKPLQIIEATEWMDDDLFDRLTKKLIGRMPNTYTFTKQLAETLVKEEAGNLPVAIIRPSIITAAWEEPYPGWTCSMCGPAGLYVALGKGFMRVFKCNTEAVSDCIPVDLVVNAILAATWYTGTYQPTETNIYNITTGGTNPHTWREMRQWGNAQLHREPLEDAIRSPYALFTNNRLVVSMGIWFYHLLPAYTGDLLMQIMGKKPKLVRIYDRLHKAMDSLTYFTSRDWNFSYKNLDTLMEYMSSDDKEKFCVDPRILQWPRYFEQYCKGVKHFILHEKPAGIPAAIARNKMLRKIEMTFNAIGVFLIWRLWGKRNNYFYYVYMLLRTVLLQVYRMLRTLVPL